jgi:hypothetical protein
MTNLKKLNAMQLTFKHALVMQEIEELPAGSNILRVKKKEAVAYEEELRTRLYGLLINSVLPVLITAPKKAEKKMMIPFHFEVFSSMNVRVDRFKIDATTKDEAWIKARAKARTYPGKVSLKIS